MGGLSQYVYPGTAVNGGGGASNGSNVTPINASANFSANQAVSGSATLAGNPLVWLLLVTAGVLVVLHTI